MSESRHEAVTLKQQSRNPPHAFRGYFFMASAAFLWAVSAALGRAVFTGKLLLAPAPLRPIDSLILSQSRTTFSLVILLPVLVISGGWQRIRLPARDLASCFLLGILGVAVSNYFYYVAIERTTVAVAIIVQYTAPVWVLICMVSLRRQKLTAQRVAAVALALTGIALVVNLFAGGSRHRLDAYGIGAALLASFSYAFYIIAGHGLLKRHDRWRVLVWTLAASAVFWLLVNPPWKIAAAHYVPAQWRFLFVFSMISVLGAFSLNFLGLQYLEPTRAVIASCLEPVFSILLAALFLSEILRPVQTVGIVLVLAAIALVQLPGRGASADEAIRLEPID
jgi:drug/metabolite transporter (DMT)-like permease